jgi:hypothetical protein
MAQQSDPTQTLPDVWQLLLAADAIGVRLEVTAGVPTWEASPVRRHQQAIDRIRATITPPPGEGACACVHLADVYIHFPDGSYKRPDISIFCREPDEEDEAITLVPTAVVEVISAGYEVKDITIGPQFYLAQGVADVIVLDPRSMAVTHYRTSGVQRGVSPLPIVTVTGCSLTV